MAISKINQSNPVFVPASQTIGSTAKTKENLSMLTPAAADAESPSTIVNLSDGVASTVIEGNAASLTAVPLATAWAPQMLVQGDTNHDEQLDLKEFANQLQRAGVAAEAAKKLFASFDTSQDGLLSVDEFAKGVEASVDSGATVFSTLSDSYVRDAAGNIDEAARSDFLAKGRALADQYAQQSGQRR